MASIPLQETKANDIIDGLDDNANSNNNNPDSLRPADDLPGIDITSAKVIAVGRNYSYFGYFFWSSAEE